MANIPVGLQMYTVRDESAKDYTGTLKKVADIGYTAVEFAGYGGLEAKELKKVLDDLGLEAPTSHVSMELLETKLQQQIEFGLEIGLKYIAVPFLNIEEQLKGEGYNRTVESLKHIAAEVKRSGMQLTYHNHDFEFQKMDGAYILDRLFEDVGKENMLAELDLYWVKKAGLDPKSYMEQLKGRCPIIHVKDMTDDERRFFAEVGHGIIDYPSIFDIADEVGVEYYIVEQDRCERPPFESIQMSMDYLKSIGIA